MEIVIETDPYQRSSSTSPAPMTTAYNNLRSPVTAQQSPQVSTNSAFYYATLPRNNHHHHLYHNQRLNHPQTTTTTLDGAPTTSAVRRVDKSGLLEMAEIEKLPPPPPPVVQYQQQHIGTLSRRLERSGLLEAVPELPDQQQTCHRELLTAEATTRSIVERQHHLEAALLRRRAFADNSLDSVQTEISEASSSGSSCTGKQQHRVKFADTEALIDEIKEANRTRRQRLNYQQQLANSLSRHVPDVVEAHGTVSTVQPDLQTNSTLNNVINNNNNNNHKGNDNNNKNNNTVVVLTSGADASAAAAPEGERAEAEGCENTMVREKENKVASEDKALVKGKNNNSTNKIGNNDSSIQAVHVIILSEQL